MYALLEAGHAARLLSHGKAAQQVRRPCSEGPHVQAAVQLVAPPRRTGRTTNLLVDAAGALATLAALVEGANLVHQREL